MVERALYIFVTAAALGLSIFTAAWLPTIAEPTGEPPAPELQQLFGAYNTLPTASLLEYMHDRPLERRVRFRAFWALSPRMSMEECKVLVFNELADYQNNEYLVLFGVQSLVHHSFRKFDLFSDDELRRAAELCLRIARDPAMFVWNRQWALKALGAICRKNPDLAPENLSEAMLDLSTNADCMVLRLEAGELLPR